jgi:hypothetical protein
MPRNRGWLRLLLAVLPACAGDRPPVADSSGLPDTVGGMAKVQSVTGQEARDLIGLLHPGPLAPAESEVGFYATDADRAVLYVSRYGSADTARQQLQLMSAVIGRGRGGFGHYSETEIGGTVVHAALGQGRSHFFFTRDREVVWLAADPEPARAALADLLHLDTDSIPR